MTAARGSAVAAESTRRESAVATSTTPPAVTYGAETLAGDPADLGRDLVVAGQRRLAGGDGPASELDLNHHLDQRADDDEPQDGEADLGAEGGGGDQLAGADDGCAHDQARPEVTEALPPSRGRFFDAVTGQLVRVFDLGCGYCHGHLLGLAEQAADEVV